MQSAAKTLAQLQSSFKNLSKVDADLKYMAIDDLLSALKRNEYDSNNTDDVNKVIFDTNTANLIIRGLIEQIASERGELQDLSIQCLPYLTRQFAFENIKKMCQVIFGQYFIPDLPTKTKNNEERYNNKLKTLTTVTNAVKAIVSAVNTNDQSEKSSSKEKSAEIDAKTGDNSNNNDNNNNNNNNNKESIEAKMLELIDFVSKDLLIDVINGKHVSMSNKYDSIVKQQTIDRQIGKDVIVVDEFNEQILYLLDILNVLFEFHGKHLKPTLFDSSINSIFNLLVGDKSKEQNETKRKALASRKVNKKAIECLGTLSIYLSENKLNQIIDTIVVNITQTIDTKDFTNLKNYFQAISKIGGGGRRLAFDNTSKLFITVMNVIKNDVLASEIEEREYGLMTLETLMLNCKNSQIITLFPQLIGFLKQQISYDPNFVSIALQEVRGTNNVASPPKSQASNVDTNMSGDNNNDTATTQAKDDNGGNDGADEDAGDDWGDDDESDGWGNDEEDSFNNNGNEDVEMKGNENKNENDNNEEEDDAADLGAQLDAMEEFYGSMQEDDSDPSWKVRRASNKCILAIISCLIDTNRDFNCNMFRFIKNEILEQLFVVLTERMTERIVNIKMDIFESYLKLLNYVINSINRSNGNASGDANTVSQDDNNDTNVLGDSIGFSSSRAGRVRNDSTSSNFGDSNANRAGGSAGDGMDDRATEQIDLTSNFVFNSVIIPYLSNVNVLNEIMSDKNKLSDIYSHFFTIFKQLLYLLYVVKHNEDESSPTGNERRDSAAVSNNQNSSINNDKMINLFNVIVENLVLNKITLYSNSVWNNGISSVYDCLSVMYQLVMKFANDNGDSNSTLKFNEKLFETMNETYQNTNQENQNPKPKLLLSSMFRFLKTLSETMNSSTVVKNTFDMCLNQLLDEKSRHSNKILNECALCLGNIFDLIDNADELKEIDLSVDNLIKVLKIVPALLDMDNTRFCAIIMVGNLFKLFKAVKVNAKKLITKETQGILGKIINDLSKFLKQNSREIREASINALYQAFSSFSKEFVNYFALSLGDIVSVCKILLDTSINIENVIQYIFVINELFLINNQCNVYNKDLTNLSNWPVFLFPLFDTVLLHPNAVHPHLLEYWIYLFENIGNKMELLLFSGNGANNKSMMDDLRTNFDVLIDKIHLSNEILSSYDMKYLSSVCIASFLFSFITKRCKHQIIIEFFDIFLSMTSIMVSQSLMDPTNSSSVKTATIIPPSKAPGASSTTTSTTSSVSPAAEMKTDDVGMLATQGKVTHKVMINLTVISEIYRLWMMKTKNNNGKIKNEVMDKIQDYIRKQVHSICGGNASAAGSRAGTRPGTAKSGAAHGLVSINIESKNIKNSSANEELLQGMAHIVSVYLLLPEINAEFLKKFEELIDKNGQNEEQTNHVIVALSGLTKYFENLRIFNLIPLTVFSGMDNIVIIKKLVEIARNESKNEKYFDICVAFLNQLLLFSKTTQDLTFDVLKDLLFNDETNKTDIFNFNSQLSISVMTQSILAFSMLHFESSIDSRLMIRDSDGDITESKEDNAESKKADIDADVINPLILAMESTNDDDNENKTNDNSNSSSDDLLASVDSFYGKVLKMVVHESLELSYVALQFVKVILLSNHYYSNMVDKSLLFNLLIERTHPSKDYLETVKLGPITKIQDRSSNVRCLAFEMLAYMMEKEMVLTQDNSNNCDECISKMVKVFMENLASEDADIISENCQCFQTMMQTGFVTDKHITEALVIVLNKSITQCHDTSKGQEMGTFEKEKLNQLVAIFLNIRKSVLNAVNLEYVEAVWHTIKENLSAFNANPGLIRRTPSTLFDVPMPRTPSQSGFSMMNLNMLSPAMRATSLSQLTRMSSTANIENLSLDSPTNNEIHITNHLV